MSASFLMILDWINYFIEEEGIVERSCLSSKTQEPAKKPLRRYYKQIRLSDIKSEGARKECLRLLMLDKR